MKNTTNYNALVSQLIPSAEQIKEKLNNINKPKDCSQTENPNLLDIPFTDVGNGQRMNALFGQDWVFSRQTNTWFEYDGLTWQEDLNNRISTRRAEMMNIFKSQLYAHSLSTENFVVNSPLDILDTTNIPKSLRTAFKFISDSDNNHRPEVCLRRFSELPGKTIDTAVFDQSRDLLAVSNAIIDLRTGTSTTPARDQFLTKRSNVKYDPTAKCPTWDKFIHTVTQGDAELAKYMQILSGYWLTGHTSDQAVYMLKGSGRNGKSVFLQTLTSLMGVHAASTSADLLTEKDTLLLSQLRGVRLAVLNELGENLRAASVRLKMLASSDTIQATKKYENPITFSPTHKLLIATNVSPTVAGWDYAICRRMRLIPFTYTIPDDQVDTEIHEKLNPELPGILNWCLEGAKQWYANNKKIEIPTIVKEMTGEYLKDQDIIGNFIEACLEATDENTSTPASCVYNTYKNWAVENGINSLLTQIMLTKDLTNRNGFFKVKKSNVPHIGGLKIKGY